MDLTHRQFWKQFFEASANVSLSGYEEEVKDEVTQTDTTLTQPQTPTDGDRTVREDGRASNDEDDFTIDSPTQATAAQTTPRLPPSASTATGKGQPSSAHRSVTPRKYTGKNPRATERASEEPSTPRPQTGAAAPSSPFEPESAYQPLMRGTRTANHDPLMHRVLDKTYRVQATPHTQRKYRPPEPAATTSITIAAAAKDAPWDESPQSSPPMAAPQLRSDLFSPPQQSRTTRTPGVSVLTPARHKSVARATSTGKKLFSPQDKAYTATKERTSHIFSDDDNDEDEDGLGGMSPPKTMQFHVPQSRLLQTPAREASKKIVNDLLLTAGADATDEIEGDEIDFTTPSPSIIKRAYADDDDTF